MKGFGFAKTDCGKEVFIHFKKLLNAYPIELQVGVEVSFELGTDAKTGKPCGNQIRITKKEEGAKEEGADGEGEGSSGKGSGKQSSVRSEPY